MAAPTVVKKGKSHLVVTMLFLGIVLVGGPYALATLRLTGTLKASAWVVLVITFLGILLKSGIAFLTTREFRYDKFAYELCILVAGGLLTCASLQITSDENLFPGLAEVSFLGFMGSLSVGTVGQHRTLLMFLFLAALVGALFSAINVSDTDNGQTSAVWDIFTCATGAALLAAYALVLVSKG